MNEDELLDYKKRLNRVIERYEQETIAPLISGMKIEFLAQVGFIVLLLIFGFITNLDPNLASLIGALGLGSLGVGANWERLQQVLNKFINERSRLNNTVVTLKNEFTFADLNEDKLRGVENLIRELYKKFSEQFAERES
jgi:hypothetical protein